MFEIDEGDVEPGCLQPFIDSEKAASFAMLRWP
jgi:hypothetical protein